MNYVSPELSPSPAEHCQESAPVPIFWRDIASSGKLLALVVPFHPHQQLPEGGLSSCWDRKLVTYILRHHAAPVSSCEDSNHRSCFRRFCLCSHQTKRQVQTPEIFVVFRVTRHDKGHSFLTTRNWFGHLSNASSIVPFASSSASSHLVVAIIGVETVQFGRTLESTVVDNSQTIDIASDPE